MTRKFTDVILGTQCIGDSLNVINNNFEILDTATASLCSLRFGTVTPSTTVAGTQTTVALLSSNGSLVGYIPVYSARI